MSSPALSRCGNYQDDYVGCDVSRGLGYAYNGDALDETNGGAQGYGENPPACRSLQTSLLFTSRDSTSTTRGGVPGRNCRRPSCNTNQSIDYGYFCFVGNGEVVGFQCLS